MPIVECADRHERGTIVGRARYRSWESITISVHSIRSGMPRQSMVSSVFSRFKFDARIDLTLYFFCLQRGPISSCMEKRPLGKPSKKERRQLRLTSKRRETLPQERYPNRPLPPNLRRRKRRKKRKRRLLPHPRAVRREPPSMASNQVERPPKRRNAKQRGKRPGRLPVRRRNRSQP
jgi:hypothetical protein